MSKDFLIGLVIVAFVGVVGSASWYEHDQDAKRNPACMESYAMGEDVKLTDPFYKNCTGFIIGQGVSAYSNHYRIRVSCSKFNDFDILITCRGIAKIKERLNKE